jgi:IS5 family transposase
MRTFVGIDLGREPVPDESTILNYHHLMERHNLGNELFRLVTVYLEENGMKVARGTIVDASIINAPSSTKNKDKKRDPEMHQTRKGNQWYFGMKAHIGVDSKTIMIHSVAATAVNVHDSQVLEDLLHGEETRVWGDSAYTGQKQVLRENAPNAKDFSQHKGSRHHRLSDEERSRNRNKSRVRSKVENIFHVMKHQFGFTRVCYRGLDKNAHFLFVNCALINPVMTKKRILLISPVRCT